MDGQQSTKYIQYHAVKKLLVIISVDFDVTDRQTLTRHSAFIQDLKHVKIITFSLDSNTHESCYINQNVLKWKVM